ncbi:guanine nucleotide exchange factor C9orf72-like [Sycon ciliatum]|uniref:guanine nucleotide exchange factor C9orf72-like n=1 Tax=Sycon ciliatum TaxID=27933 RepID=UPI0031F68041|eukprot:scpid40883/ scgid14894/ Uncharacterized protein C9orf72
MFSKRVDSLSGMKAAHRCITLPSKTSDEGAGAGIDGNPFFTAALLSMWDNIVGPRIQCEWNMFDSAWQVPEQTIEYVANHTLNGEICRTEELAAAPGQIVENKLYVLSDHDVLVTAFIFSCFQADQGPCVYSLCLLMPLQHRAGYLPLHKFCEQRMKECVDRLTALYQQYTDAGAVMDEFGGEMPAFMSAVEGIYRMSLRDRLTTEGTSFDGNDSLLDVDFLRKCITSHLQTCGSSIVIGKSVLEVNKTLKTLALFLSPHERKCSRLVDGDCPDVSYEPDLFLQGLIIDGSGNVRIPEQDITRSRLPSSLIDLDRLTVKQTNQLHKHDVVRQEFLEMQHMKLQRPNEHQDDGAQPSICRFHATTDRSELVNAFVQEVFQLNPLCGVREAYIDMFVRRLHRSALALIAYVQADPMYKAASESVSASSGNSSGILSPTMGGGGGGIGSGVTGMAPNAFNIPPQQASARPATVRNLRSDLSLENDADFKIILATAEKLHSGLFTWLLGDPRLQGERYQHEFEAL